MLNRLWLFMFFIVSISVFSQNNELDSIFTELDKTLMEKSVYIELKEQHIAELKNMRDTTFLPEQRFYFNNKLYNEYRSYIPDSATVFLYDNICIASNLNNSHWLVQCKLKLLENHIAKGMLLDVWKVLDTLRPLAYEQELMADYYLICRKMYYFYPQEGNRFHPEYYNYLDSLSIVFDKNTPTYSTLIAEKLIGEGRYEDARYIFLSLFEKAPEGSPSQARLANEIGKTYQRENDYEMQKKYFAISAIGNIKKAVRENESFRSLAIACYMTNDIDRAYRYISKSMDDALFINHNARMVEVSQFFPIIEKSYQFKIQQEKNRFFRLSILTSIIAILLVIGIVFIYLQMKRLAAMGKNLAETNRQLKQINKEITQINKDLSEVNMLKETYITQFLNVCSLYVRKLEKFQSFLNKKTLENNTEELGRILKSRDMIESEQKELHKLFDKIFLNLYPDFVSEINKLLPPSEQFDLNDKESLTTELRIFALIRLGITDSAAIAEFLRNSIKTIYNYRTRLRNKSLVSGEEFEAAIKRINIT